MGENRTFQDKFMLRLPEGMRDMIAAAAKASGRSMNAEIVFRLQASFFAPRPEVTAELEHFLNASSRFEERLKLIQDSVRQIKEDTTAIAKSKGKG